MQIHFLIKVTDVAPRESSQLLTLIKSSLHCQHIPLHHTLVKAEALISNSESVPYMRVRREYLVIFLGIPNQKVSQKNWGVSACGWLTMWSSCRFVAATGHRAVDKTFPSALCENRICGNTLFWLFLHILSPWSKEKRKGLQIHFNLGCLFSLRWMEC